MMHSRLLALFYATAILILPSECLNYGDTCIFNPGASEPCYGIGAGVACRSGRCQCPTNSTKVWYDMVKKQCVTQMGEECSNIYPNNVGCVTGYCNYNPTGSNYTCSCWGTSPAADKLSCLSGMGGACFKNADCETSQLTVCRRGKCDCPGSTSLHGATSENYYDTRDKICRVNTGSLCIPGAKLGCDPALAKCVPVQTGHPVLGQDSWCRCNPEVPTPREKAVAEGMISYYSVTECVKG